MFRFFVCALSMGLIAGCGANDHTSRVRSRFIEFAGHLVREDLDACLTLIDPLTIQHHGKEKVKFKLQLLSAYIKFGNVADTDMRIDDIVVAEDRKSAQVRFSLQSNGEWKSQDAAQWVHGDGQWFLTY